MVRTSQWITSVALAFVAATSAAHTPSDSTPVSGAAAASTSVHVSTVRYAVPDIELVRQDGHPVKLVEEMNDGRPVVLNFIFTTCGSICPLMSQVFGQFQQSLGAERSKVHLMSISTDPEEDTPARLREYAAQFKAGASWQHYTGTQQASVAAQRAFGVYRGDKMSHAAVTLMRLAPGQPWVRLDGFATPTQLMQHYRELFAAK
jgi:protein SCO1